MEMFTHKTLPLSDFASQVGSELLRNAQVSFAAKLPYDLPNRIVPCIDQQNIRKATATTGVVALIAPSKYADSVPLETGLCLAADPIRTALELHELLSEIPDFQWRSFPSEISETALVHPTAFIAERDVTIGPHVRIGPKAMVFPRSVIGADSSIGPGSVVGCDAFQVIKSTSTQRIIKQSGGVRIGRAVDIQSNCTISRAIFGGFTEIGDETLLDSQVHVGHDCKVGKKVLITNQVSLAGRVHVEDGVYIGPNATVSNGVTLKAGSQVTIGSVVLRDTLQGQKVTGYNALQHDQWMLQTIRSMKRK